MSDDVFAVRTTFQDVAELGQGYLERADGERMLLPLPLEIAEGEGVRFIVYLVDGTPAFAGAGRCVQVSDQGPDVSSEERYETLIDGLVFDERSRPVYDYIVAVRQMAYADLGAATEAEAANGDETVLESEEPTNAELADPALLAESVRSDPPPSTEPEGPNDTISVPPHENPFRSAKSPVAAALASPDFSDDEDEASAISAEATPADHNPGLTFAREEAEAEVEAEPPAGAEPPRRSFIPLPTGILRRPAIAVGWYPAAPQRPQPHPGTGRFRYTPGKLPIPKAPPRPDLHPDLRVQPAASPASN